MTAFVKEELKSNPVKKAPPYDEIGSASLVFGRMKEALINLLTWEAMAAALDI